MKKTLAALVAVTTIAGSLAVAPAAKAGDGAVAAGVVGGLVGGALLGSAIAGSRPAYAAPAPVYVEEAPYPACRMVGQRFWDGYGWRFRRVQVCD